MAMTKHNKNAKSKKRVLKKKSLRKTKRKNSKNSKRGGNFSSSAFYNKFKEGHKNVKNALMDTIELKEGEDALSEIIGRIAFLPILVGFYIVQMIIFTLPDSLYAAFTQRSDNSYYGGSIFRDGNALTHKNPCQGNENETVVVKGWGMGLETHDEIYVCKNNKINYLESIARTRINRYISRIGMKQLRYKRKYHLLAALYNVPDTFDKLKTLLDDASQNNPKLKKYITDNLSDLNDVVKTRYADIVKALKNAVKHYCVTNNNDQELSEVCEPYNQEQKTNNQEQTTNNQEQTTDNQEQTTNNQEQKTNNQEQKTDNKEQISTNKNKNTEGFMEGVKVFLLPTLKEMGKYINA